MDNKDITRRDFIQRVTLFGAAGLGAGSLLAACGGEQPAPTPSETPTAAPEPSAAAQRFTCMDTAGLTEKDVKMRTALKYVDKSAQAGKQCDNCAFWLNPAEGSPCGTCQTVKGPIHPEGYCKIWAQRTG